MPYPPAGKKFKHSNKRGRGGKRRKTPVERPETPSTTVLFETFEPRVLLDAVLPVNPIQQTNSVANGTVLASDTQPGTVQDGDGTTVTVSITGSGHWAITQQTLAPALGARQQETVPVDSPNLGGIHGVNRHRTSTRAYVR